MSDETKKTEEPELNDEQLDEASGGLLLPAVQKVREAAATEDGVTEDRAQDLASDGTEAEGGSAVAL